MKSKPPSLGQVVFVWVILWIFVHYGCIWLLDYVGLSLRGTAGTWFAWSVGIILAVLLLAAWIASLIDFGRPPRQRRKIPVWVRSAVLFRDGYRCKRCGSRNELQLDHVKPFSWGGGDEISNLQTLCGPCNRRKSNRWAG